MADVAEGNEGRARSGAFARLGRGVPLAVAVSLAGVACDGTERSGRAEAGAAGAAGADAYAGLESLLSAALDERLGGAQESVRPDVPLWPKDLRFHPETRVESIELLALLEDDSGRVYSFNRRFDRLSLGAGQRGRSANGAAGFAFDDVVLLAGETLVGPPVVGSASDAASDTVSDGGPLHSRALIERAALGLAIADERQAVVRDVRLERAMPDGDSAAGIDCAYGWRLVEGDALALRFLASACPTGALLGGLALATSAPLEVDGTLQAGGERRRLTGHGWARRAWGEVPAPGGAVVFDRLLLDVEGLGTIEVTRSKRRSGRGPRTATARLRDGSVETEIAVEWMDVTGSVAGSADGPLDGQAGAHAVPASWRFEVEPLGVDVTLIPPAGGLARQDVTGLTWRGAVRAEGSHRGVGFVEFVPIGAAPSNAEGRS